MPRSLLFVLLVVWVLWPHTPTHAQIYGQDWGCTGTLRDRDGDGTTDMVVLQGCTFATSSDQVLIYDRDGSMADASTWQDAANFSTALWLFDAGNNGVIDLALDFSMGPDGEAIARLFDRQDGPSLGIAFPQGVPQVTNPFPTVTVTAADGWWVRDDGLVNFNLFVEIDGGVLTLNDSVRPTVRTPDGIIDAHITVTDIAGAGVPLQQAIQRYFIPANQGSPRTWLTKNVALTQYDTPPQDSIFWPHLATGNRDFVRLTREHAGLAAIRTDWLTGTLVKVIQFVPSHAGEYNWWANSIAQIDEQNAVGNFETPFAFYDLAQDEDGLPELVVRFEHDPAFDPLLNPSDVPNQAIRFAWNQQNHDDIVWDFKLGLHGRYTLENLVTVANTQVLALSHDDIPEWVTERTWDLATFNAFESVRPYRSSEGVYEWSTSTPLMNRYVDGQLLEPPLDDYQDIERGMRGELAFPYSARPRVYISSIDGRLHLLGAQQGVYNHDDIMRVRVWNDNDDPYLDRWELEVRGQVVARLAHSGNMLIYTDARRTLIKRLADVPHSRYETLAPSTHELWRALGEALSAHASDVPLHDLYGLFRSVPGERVWAAASPAPEYQVTPDGFRLLISAAETLRTAQKGQSGLRPAPLRLTDGDRTVLESTNDTLQLRPARPLQISIGAVDIQPQQVVPRQVLRINTHVVNQGDAFSDDLVLLIYATQTETADAVPVSLHVHPINLPGGGDEHVFALTVLPEVGEWQVNFAVFPGDASVSFDEVPTSPPLTMTSQTLTVVPLAFDPWWLFQQGRYPFGGLLLVVVVSMTALAAGLLMVALLQRLQDEREAA